MPLKSLANTSTKNNLLIVIAHSARALAESGSRAGYQVVSVDGFADLDTQEASLECWCLPLVNGEFTRLLFLTCLQKLHTRFPQARVVLAAGAELFMREAEAMPGWRIVGNSAVCVESVLDPHRFFAGLDALSIDYPGIRWDAPAEDSQSWLCKTPARCGGMGVQKICTGESRKHSDHYWQKEVDGQPISALFLSGQDEWRLLGFNQQLVQPLSPQLPYIYSGAIANIEVENKVGLKIKSYIEKLIKYFRLIGLCSIDLLVRGDEILVLEINPRISATYQLYERLQPSMNLVDAHVRVCEGERLSALGPVNGQVANWILFAGAAFKIPDRVNWPNWVSDRPQSGRQIKPGEPLCTLQLEQAEMEQLETVIQEKEKHVLSILRS